MLEKIKNNPAGLVVGLVAAGLAVLIITGGDNKPADPIEDTAVVQEQDAASETSDENAVVLEPIGSEPSGGPVEVEANEDESVYSATVRSGDNQTVIVRQIVSDFLNDKSINLNTAQRLYAETVLVNGLPRDDTIFAGQTVSLPAGSLQAVIDDAAELSDEQQARWSRYL